MRAHQKPPETLKLISGGVGEGGKKEFVQLPLFESYVGIHPVELALQGIIQERSKLIKKWARAEESGNIFAQETYEKTIAIIEDCYYHVVNKFTKKLRPANPKDGLKLVKGL